MKILVVEDEMLLAHHLGQSIREAGHSVDTARDGKDGLRQGSESNYDLAVIDLGLPELDGISLIRELRQRDKSYPILILTARDQWQDKVEGLEAGADDYLTKPFHREELLARIKALIRRSAGHASSVITLGPIALDMGQQQVRLNDQPVELTAYEYKVLEYLALHPDKVVSKTELTEHIYEQDFDRDSNVIEVFVRRLRLKLDPENQLKPIETLRGRGYRIHSPPP